MTLPTTPDPCRLNRRIWDYWLAGVLGSFAVIEYQALKNGCHPTLSRVLHGRHAGPVLFAGGCALAVHVVRLQAES